MARPTKQGIEYFPLNVDFNDDTKLFLAETESDGLAVLIALYQIVYKNEGYYVIYDDYLLPKLKQRSYVNIDRIIEIISKLFIHKIIDQTLYEKYNILTSAGIQERYFAAAKRKNKILYEEKFSLINVSEYKNLVNVNIYSINDNIYTPKEKQSKAKEEVKEKQTKKGDIPDEYSTYYPNHEENEKQRLKLLLLNRNIPETKAQQIINSTTLEYLDRKIQEFDYVEQYSPQKMSISKPGYLVKSIEQDYAQPEEFIFHKFIPKQKISKELKSSISGIGKKLPFKNNKPKEKFTKINSFTIKQACQSSKTMNEVLKCFNIHLQPEIKKFLIEEKNITDNDWNKSPQEVLL